MPIASGKVHHRIVAGFFIAKRQQTATITPAITITVEVWPSVT
jgi:hypothetical protein